MHTDPAIPIIVSVIFSIVFLGFIMRWLRQPHVIVYLLVGVVLGPHLLGVITEQEVLTRAGAFGVIMLLFFIGMESSPKRLVKNWFVSVFGTILQIIISIGAVAILGMFLGWSFSRILFFGFVTSLSSTAVVLKLLEDWDELDTRIGQDVLGVLLVQDLLVIPMLIILDLLGGGSHSWEMLTAQIGGGIAIIVLAGWLVKKEEIRLPWIHHLGSDHEMQLFLALGICFGMAMFTGSLALSAPLGAFIGGMIVSSAKQTHWVCQSLSSFRTIFMAIFFVSVGMMIDIEFISKYAIQISLLVLAATVTNTIINAVILRTLGANWNASIYGASLLSQIGEFSFVIAAVGLQANIINQVGYQLTISVISLTLMISPLWIATLKHFTKVSDRELRPL
jgi:CPA2 family monovalent cation:H+ antiporter-2